jgi:hypothetical protein
LRKCDRCGSINQDDEHVCGVCGRDLSDLPSVSFDQATRIHESPVRFKRGTRRVGIVEILSGTIIIVLGAVSLLAGPLSSATFRLGLVMFPLVLVLWLVGLFVIVVGISSMSQSSRPVIKRGFGRGGPIMRPSGGSGWEHSYRETDREKSEDQRKETGESD